MPTLLPGILSVPKIATGITPSQKTKDAVVQFEALLVGQILKSAHEEEGGWLDAGEDQTAGSAMQMADEYFARALTLHGGLGLARMISAGLDQAVAEGSNRSSPAK
jgi:Rod binding domain-containing protein